jgi:hypothetical protein
MVCDFYHISFKSGNQFQGLLSRRFVCAVGLAHGKIPTLGESVGILVVTRNANVFDWAEFEPAIQAFSRRNTELALNLTTTGISRP